MKRAGKRVPGIGHRIKSKDNRDARVDLLQAYAREHFPSTKYLEYALTVEVWWCVVCDGVWCIVQGGCENGGCDVYDVYDVYGDDVYEDYGYVDV